MSEVGVQITKPQLEHIDIEITRNCNYDCMHCSAGKYEQQTLRELDIDEIKSIIDSSVKIGLNKIGFTGGEPLLLKDKLFELIKYSKNNYNLPVHMHSNGSLIDEEIAKKLKQFDVLTTISIFSMKEQINDQITNKKGSLIQSLNGIKNAIKYDLNLHVFIVPLKQNVSHIKDLIIKLNKIGVNNFRLLSLSPTGKALNTYDDISLNKDDINKLSNDLTYLNDNYDVNIQCGFCTHQSLPDLLYLKGHDQCYSGKNRVHIDSSGNVYPCTAASGRAIFSVGNLRNSNINEIWEYSPLLQFIRRFHIDRPNKCTNCIEYPDCMGGCRVLMSYRYGDYTVSKPNCGGPYTNDEKNEA